MTTKSKTKKAASINIYKLTIGEMITLLNADDSGICRSGARYIRHGTNLRAAFFELKKNKGDYDTFLNVLGIERDYNVPKKVIDAIKNSTKGLTATEITTKLKYGFNSNLWKSPTVSIEKEFQLFKKSLYNRLNKAVSNLKSRNILK